MKKRAHITLVNGMETSALDIADRGLAYGDGVFETLRVLDGAVPLLDWHLARFKRGVEVLALGDTETLLAEFQASLTAALQEVVKSAHLNEALVKIIVTRGMGGRGYLPPEYPHCNLITQVFEKPTFSPEFQQQGISLQLCQHRLSTQPALAGLKHLNRLDQVMASRELKGKPEGLMLDQQGHVIEGTKSNLLWFEGSKVYTPELSECGVAGSLRACLLNKSEQLGLDIIEAQADLARIESAEGLAMINSVFGIWSVAEFNGQDYARHQNYGIIRDYLAAQYSY